MIQVYTFLDNLEAANNVTVFMIIESPEATCGCREETTQPYSRN